MSKALSLILVAVGLGVFPLVAQQVPTVPLGRAEATLEEPYTQIASVRELPGGKVLVVDTRDKVLQLVDLRAGTATRIGREGSGPGEYQFPRNLLAMPNNETWLNDPMQSRFLRIDATGKIVETISYPSGMGPGNQIVGADAQGRVYYEGSAFGSGGGQLTFGPGSNGQPETRDSVPVIRWDRRANRFDTLAMVKGPQMKVNLGGGANSRSVMIRQQPYTPRDGWGVAQDGRVALVRSGEYRVDQIRPQGGVARGPAVGMRPIPVTQRDKEDFLKQQRNAPRMMRTVGGGGNASAPTPPEPSVDDYEWPVNKPFFDAASVRMSPTGEFWSLRSRPAGDEIPVYDVFGADGRLVRRVSFPAKTRLVGFGEGTVYVARSDEDDLQYLERYRMP